MIKFLASLKPCNSLDTTGSFSSPSSNCLGTSPLTPSDSLSIPYTVCQSLPHPNLTFAYAIPVITFYLFHEGSAYHIETSTLISSANQCTGFYVVETSLMTEINLIIIA